MIILEPFKDKIKIIASPLSMFIMTSGYLSSIVILRNFMKNRSSYRLKRLMQFYNLSQIILNIYMICGIYKYTFISTKTNLFGINLMYNSNIEYYVFVHYLSKYFDYIDTIFIILKKADRQLTFLHVYHHSTIGIIWGSLLYIGHGNGTVMFGCLINSIIHTLMYSHYLCASFGIYNPFKKIVTQAQIFQFVLCIIHSISVMIWENICPRHLAWFQFIYQIQMIMLFTHFYKNNYRKIKL